MLFVPCLVSVPLILPSVSDLYTIYRSPLSLALQEPGALMYTVIPPLPTPIHPAGTLQSVFWIIRFPRSFSSTFFLVTFRLRACSVIPFLFVFRLYHCVGLLTP